MSGRPRNESHCRAIREAALSLVLERGFSHTSIESIAERAGVGKATVYRRWANKSDLIVHAFFEVVAAQVRIQETGDLRRDFKQQLRLAVQELNGRNGRILAMLFACMQDDEALANSFRNEWLTVRRAAGRQVLQRGIERGEIPAGTDPNFVLDALYSPIHFRLIAGHAPLTVEFSDALVDLIFDGLGAGKRAHQPPPKTTIRRGGRR